MELLMAIGTSVVGKVAEYTVEPVARQIGYFFYYKRNVDNLKNQIQDFKLAKERIEHSVGTARRNGEEIEGDVKNWLSKAETISYEAEKLLPIDEDRANTRCSGGSLSKLLERYKLSKEANKMVQVITQLQELGIFSKVSYRPALNNSFKIKGYEEFESRAHIVKEIMEALRDDGVRMIGVWGMGGVGKTMLVKEVARQARSENLFTQIVLTTISQTQDHKRVQEEVAENLGLNLEESTISVRAKRLKDRLRNEKKILIILDDLWSKLDLEDVGITFADDQKECKLLLTSRSSDVLCNEMGSDRSFKLVILSYYEAIDLFDHLVGDLANENEFQNLKEQIVKECVGLPLAISTIANALKNKCSISIWKNALQELRMSSPVNIKGMDEKVYSSIKLSYQFLQSEEAKSLLLLCCLHKEDEDVAIDDLLKYGMGLSLFQGVRKLDDARNRVYHLVENLKTSSMLFDSQNDCYVRLHDVIRDVVLSIASKDRQMYFISSVKELNESLDNEELGNSTAIACFNRGTNDLLPERLMCPKLQLFSLQHFSEKQCLISSQFFEGDNELRVLNLHGVFWDLSSLSSFQFLKNLRALIVSSCILSDIKLVGELKGLEILRLTGFYIEVVPKQLEKLTRLRSLDFNNCHFLNVIEFGAISSLELLEEFTAKSFTRWASLTTINGENSKASLIELKQLRHLTTLQLEIPNATNVLPNDLFNDKLERYDLRISSSCSLWNLDYPKQRSRSLVLDGLSNSLLEHSGLKILIKRALELYISKVESINDLFHELGEGDFSHLKILSFKDDATVRYIINRHTSGNISAFPSLEKLYLGRLKNLETICNGCELSMDSLAKLRVTVVQGCCRLKNLLPLSVACRQLEKIKVSYCEVMEEIFTNVENLGEVEEMIEFPCLRSMELDYLPKLMQFCRVLPAAQERDEGQVNKDAVYADTQPLFHHKFAFPNLQILDLNRLSLLEMIWQGGRELIVDSFCKLKEIYIIRCNTLRKVFPSNMLRNLKSLTKLKIEECDKVEEVFEIQSFASADENRERIIPYLLTSLELNSLPKLKNVWSYKEGCHHFQSGPPRIAFQQLKEVNVYDCQSLMYLFPAPVVKSLLRLESLKLRYCRQIKELVAEEGEAEIIPKFVLPQLTTLTLQVLPELERFYHGLHTSEWPSLKELELEGCGKIQVFASQLLTFKDSIRQGVHAKTPMFLTETVAFPNLKTMNLSSLDRLEMIWQGDCELTADSFCKLKRIFIKQCHTLIQLFPSNLVRNLMGLTELNIGDCFNLKEIFEIRRSKTVDESCERIIPQKLKKCVVDSCHRLKSLFPASIAKGLLQLESLELHFLEDMQEIVAKEEGEVETIPKFVFPQLTYMSLSCLHGLERFYPGLHSSEWPSLKELKLEYCGQIKIFSSQLYTFNDDINEEAHAISPLFLAETVAFPNMEIMNLISLNQLEMIWQGDHELITDSFCKLKVIHIKKCNTLRKVFPSNLLKNLQSLTKLEIEQCDKVDGVFEIQRSTSAEESCESVIPQLTFIELKSLPKLKNVCVISCRNLKTMSPAPFAEGLHQLEILELSSSNKIKDLVAKEEGEFETIFKFVFPQLTNLSLNELPELECFYPGLHSSEWPSLRELKLYKCGKIKILASQLLSFKDNISEEAHAKTPLFFTETVAFPTLEMMNLITLDQLEIIWQGEHELTADSFSKLKEIRIEHCKTLIKLLPLNFLRNLKSLTQLTVGYCSKLEEVFEIQRSTTVEESCRRITPQLTSFELDSLLKLKRVCVISCRSLRSLFPVSVAKVLLQLESLQLWDCYQIQELVAKEEGEVETNLKFVFPKLTTLYLEKVPKLECFYRGQHSLECPSLGYVPDFKKMVEARKT